MEFLSENPNVDVSHAWERCWGIQTGIIERVKERFSVEKHPSCAGRDYFVSDEHPKHGQLEGSFTAYSGEEVDWLVHSWLGNRQRSILDINATVFLGQETRVPHLAVIFGTIPFLYFYAEYTPRMDLRTNPDYLMNGEGEPKVSQNKETKTIMEFLSENPNVDVSHAWELSLIHI